MNGEMNIAVPVVDIRENSGIIAPGLNVNGSLCIYNPLERSAEWIKTTDLAQDMGQLLPALERKLVSAIITGEIHPMALKVLVNKGFSVFRSNGNSLDENLELFFRNELVPFDMLAAMDFATVCGGACDSCDTECKTPPKS